MNVDIYENPLNCLAKHFFHPPRTHEFDYIYIYKTHLCET